MIPHAIERELTYDAWNVSQERELIRMNFGEVFEIRDLRNHSAGTVMKLAFILAGTMCVRPTKRKYLYEVEDGSDVYYIHVSPVTGIIYLLAVWQTVVAQSNPVLRPVCVSGARIAPLGPSLEECSRI